MKFNLPILLAVLCVAGTAASGQEVTKGQHLIVRAASMLRQHRRLEANVRQQISLFGQQLSGPGYYAQYGDDKAGSSAGAIACKLQLKISFGGKVASLEQVCDGRFLYTRYDLPWRNSLTFIDLDRVRKAIQSADQQPPPSPTTNWMAHGGLSHLVEQLDKHFHFSQPRAGKLGKSKIPVWSLQGTWKPEMLAKLLPDQASAIAAGKKPQLDELPEQIPHNVAVTLGRAEPFELFPYQIIFYRNTGDSRSPILTLQFFSVRHRETMHASEFDYRPNDQELVDQTGAYMKKLGLVD